MPLRFGCIFSEALCESSLELHPGELNYSLEQQRHAWQNRSIAGSYIRSYKIKQLLDNKYMCRQFFIVDVVDNVD